MIAHIIGCGPSGQHWNGVGFSIGVNDCFKFGQTTDYLVVVNSLDNYPERKKIVEESRPRKKLLGLESWCRHPNYEHIAYMNKWRGKIERGNLYKSKTSPFIAVTMAYSFGYDKIVLWGVDFVDHPNVNGAKLSAEVQNYLSLQIALQKKGCSMYLGATAEFTNEGVLKDQIPNFRIV